MAITKPPGLYDPSIISGNGMGPIGTSPLTISPIDHAIRGEMISVIKVYDYTHRMNSPMDDEAYKKFIKQELVNLLAEELWKNNHIEFTKEENPMDSRYMYRARIFATPDDQVRILRTLRK